MSAIRRCPLREVPLYIYVVIRVALVTFMDPVGILF